MKLIIWNL